MKRIISIFCLMFILLSAVVPLFAFAAEPVSEKKVADPSNVTITVVLPDPAPEPEQETPVPSPAPVLSIKAYPSDVTETRDSGGRQIIKTYELSTSEKPEDIPRDDFERDGWRYSLTDITRKETANAVTREHSETVTLETDTKELEQILPLLSPTMEYKAEDGFVGVLTLDVASIKVETAGTKTSSYTMNVTREYPNLSNNDTSLVPKTVEDNGRTFTLAGIDWRAGNTATVDYDALPEYYTAVASYTATATSTKITGYTTTAEYSGTLAKLSQGKTLFTAYFLGKEIVPERTPLDIVDEIPAAPQAPEELKEPSPEPAAEPVVSPEQVAAPEAAAADTASSHRNGALPVLMPVIGIACGVAAYYIMRKYNNKKEKSINEKISDPVANPDPDAADGDPGSGGD